MTYPEARPSNACVLHPPPRPGYSWRRADKGFLTCGYCYGLLHRWLSPLGKDDDGRPDNLIYFYLALDTRPGGYRGGRRVPGFSSRSPANDHVIALTDARTTVVEETDPWSIYGVLRQWVDWVIASRYEAPEHGNYAALPGTVADASVWLDRQLDWMTRQAQVEVFYAHVRELRRQLRAAVGEAGLRPVGFCIENLATGRCGAPIFMPKGSPPRAPDEPIVLLPELRCPVCDSRYTGTRLLRLGQHRAVESDCVGVPAR